MGLANLYTMLYPVNWARPDEELCLMPSGHKKSSSNVEKAHEMLKELLIVYRFKPSGRVNEGELARQHSFCRTPPRGILSWLTS